MVEVPKRSFIAMSKSVAGLVFGAVGLKIESKNLSMPFFSITVVVAGPPDINASPLAPLLVATSHAYLKLLKNEASLTANSSTLL